MKKIVILTATRSEYGLLASLIKKMSKEEEIDVRVAVTGTHLSPEFGRTVNEIRNDGVTIDKEIEILLSSDSPSAISKSMGLALLGFSDYFAELKPDALMVLGDRYETLAVGIAALNERIPIIHLHGGEATEGLIDEAVRNSITKLSALHFTSTEMYRKRVIQMGEKPENVFNVGAMGVENALNLELMSKTDLENSIGCKLNRKYAVLTFHPVTLEKNTAEKQVGELLKAVECRQDILFLCTKANADTDGRIINQRLSEYETNHDNLRLFDSLGMKRYLSALKYAEFAIGNSSSGLIEVPCFGIPTINIGNRQKGRIQAESVLNCEPVSSEIISAISKAMDTQFKEFVKKTKNPYGDGKTSDKIVQITAEYLKNNKFTVQKSFYDIDFEVAE